MEPTPKTTVKIKVDTSRKYNKIIKCVVRDNQAKIIMTKGKHINEYPILVTECFIVQEALMVAVQKNMQEVIIESDSQLLT